MTVVFCVIVFQSYATLYIPTHSSPEDTFPGDWQPRWYYRLMGTGMCFASVLRPLLNIKLFPVHRPGGLKRLTGTLFFHIFKKYYFFYLFPLYILVYKKNEIRKKKKSQPGRVAVFAATWWTGNDFLLKGGLMETGLYFASVLRPPLNKKLFPVHHPSGLKRADWNFFSIFSKNTFFIYLFPLYILVYKIKKKLGEKKKKVVSYALPEWPKKGQLDFFFFIFSKNIFFFTFSPCTF